jgi:hypothetical protein
MQSKERAKDLYRELVYDGINVDVIHAERTQQQREDIIRWAEGCICSADADVFSPYRRIDLKIFYVRSLAHNTFRAHTLLQFEMESMSSTSAPRIT